MDLEFARAPSTAAATCNSIAEAVHTHHTAPAASVPSDELGLAHVGSLFNDARDDRKASDALLEDLETISCREIPGTNGGELGGVDASKPEDAAR